MAYFFIGLLMFLFTSLEQLKYNKVFSRIFLGIFTFILILFVGLRDGTSVGTDSPAYYANYLYKFWDVEYGYKFLNEFFSTNDINYNIFLIFINTISLFNISKFIKYNSPYFLIPLFIYFSDFFLYYNFSGIRQAIALSFTALSVNYTLQDKKIKAFFLIVFGAFFHITALIFLVSLIIPNKRMTSKNYIKFLLIILIGTLVSNYLIENIEYLRYKFMYYSEWQEKSDNIFTSYIIGALKRLIILGGVFAVRKTFFKVDRNTFLFNIYLVGFIIYLATYLISPDFGVRFSTYFTVMDCVIVGNILFLAKKSSTKFIWYFIFVIMAMYKISTYSQLPSYQYNLYTK